MRDREIAKELHAATMDMDLPLLDLHGLVVADVEFEVSRMLEEYPGQCIRIVTGQGTGTIATEVSRYLKQQKYQGGGLVVDFQKDGARHAVVVKVK